MFMKWYTDSPSTYGKRKVTIERQQNILEENMRELQKSLAIVEFKKMALQASRRGLKRRPH